MSKKLAALLAVLLALLGAVLYFRFGATGAGALWSVSEGGKWLLPLISVAALLDSVNPCAFSILLLTIAFLFSIGRLRTNILKIGLSYITGIFLAYLLIGLGLLSALHFFNTPHFMGRLGALLLIVLGAINLINEFFPAFPIKLRIPHAVHHKIAEVMEKASVPMAFILGGLVGVCEFPCTGGPYLMVLGLLHDQVTYSSGFGYLILYNLIFILPLLLILFIASDQTVIGGLKNWQEKEKGAMRYLAGLLMIVLGLFILLI